jgi:hypothetical protein
VSARALAVLLVLLAALGGGALLYYRQEQSRRPPDAAALGQPLLKGLKAAEIGTIAIRAPKGQLTLERRDRRWVVAERAGYPADLDKVRDFVVQAIGLRIGEREPIGEKDRARLHLDASGTRVEFKNAQGKTLASFIAGKKYFKHAPEHPDKALGDGRFVLLPGDPGRVVVVAAPLEQATTRTADWVSHRGLAIDRQTEVDYRPAAGEGWRLARTDENAPWKLVGLRAHEKLEITKANAAAYTFQILDIADVAPKDAQPKDLGLEHPDVVTIATSEGLHYTIRVGKLSGTLYPMTLSVSGEPKVEGKDAAQRRRKLDARLAHERALEGTVLLVEKNRLEDALKKRSELLAKPETKKKK